MARVRPFGVLLRPRNLESATAAAALVSEIRGLHRPAPLLLVAQEGGPVDPVGALLGVGFPSASYVGEKGADRVHETAYLMGQACRTLGFDVDLAPVVDLWQPLSRDAGGTSPSLEGRTFAFHAEDVALSGMVFLHGLARAGVATCLKHFPGLGRATAASPGVLPVVDAHDVDLMVTDVAPFTRLARLADGVMVSHAAYPDFTGDEGPASFSPRIHGILRGPVGFAGVSYSDDLEMEALPGTIPERALAAARAGCDVLCVSGPLDAFEESIAAVSDLPADAAVSARLDALRVRCEASPRPPFDPGAWERLAGEVARLLERLEKPRERQPSGEEREGR